MKKIIMVCLVLMLFCTTNIVGAEPVNESEMTAEIYQVQTLANMKLGMYAIPEKVLNSYFANIAKSNPKVKDAALSVLAKDKILVTINVDGVGVLRLTCAIKELHFDKDNALLELYIEKKEIVGNSMATFFLNKMSLGFLTDIYGNPLKDVNGKINGNSLAIDLKPFATSLFKNGIGQSVFDMIAITKATTEPGIIYLHTNLAVSILEAATKGK